MMAVDSNVADENKGDAVTNASRNLLKCECAVAKYGMFMIFRAAAQWQKMDA
jgi:L-lactate utilization protein LutC